MAENKKTTTTKKSTSSSLSLSKISFYCIGAMAILYMIATALSLLGLHSMIIGILQGLSSAIAICIVAYVAWSYVKYRTTVWKVLYFVFLIIVLIGIILPMI